jgi:hypothetical protein
LILGGSGQSANNDRRTLVDAYFAPGLFGFDAVADVGIFPGLSHPTQPDLWANSYTLTPESNGSGTVVRWTYSNTRTDTSGILPFDVLADLDAYSYSVGNEIVSTPYPVSTTRSFLLPPIPVGGGFSDPIIGVAWGEEQERKAETTYTRITLRTSATSADLGFVGSNKAGDLAQVLIAAQSTNQLVVIGGKQYLYRVNNFQQASTPRDDDFATALWDIEYTLLYDPGVRGDTGAFVPYDDQNALVLWTTGDGSTSKSRGRAVPHVPSPYAVGAPSGRWQRPPFSETFMVPDPAEDSNATEDSVPFFGARALYDNSPLDFFGLPGVP